MPYSPEHKEKSKKRILQCATDLFCRYGFDKVSINQVMKLAKMTHGAFYSHFKSKEDLYRETAVETLKRSEADRLIKSPFSIHRLMDLASGYLNLRNTNSRSTPSTEAFLSNDIANNNIEVKKQYEQSYLSLLKLFENRIVALNRLKNSSLKLDKATISDKARAILASLIGAIAIAKSINHKEEREAVLIAAQNQIFTILGFDESEYCSK